MDMETSAPRDSREATAQTIRFESDPHVPTADVAEGQEPEVLGPPAANRHRLPNERPAITHHFAVGGHEGYLTVGLYPNGQPGEIFIRMAKEGSTIAGLMECSER
jgi:ribonucleoside-diphosphate reductase alpha chain